MIQTTLRSMHRSTTPSTHRIRQYLRVLLDPLLALSNVALEVLQAYIK